jgi:hypothetical protein
MKMKTGSEAERRKRKNRPRKGGSTGFASELLRYKDQKIVLDTASDFIFIGKLSEVGDYFISLSDVDVHDRRESPSMNEKYLIDSKKFGTRFNRKSVHVRLDKLISFSILDDIVEY